MRFLSTLLVLLFVSFASAQDVNKENNNTLNNKEVKSEVVKANDNAIVISVKGIKTMEEIDIENYNKSSYLKLIASKKQESKMC